MGGLDRVGKVDFADRLRGIAALSVLISHLFGVFWTRPEAVQLFLEVPTLPAKFGVPIYVAIIQAIPSFDWGAFGVSLFFLVSGFVIPFSLGRYSRAGFAVARALRLIPTYIAGFAITLLALWLVRWHFDRPFGIAWTDIVAHLVPGVRDLLGTRNIDGIIWTLEVEVKFYILCMVAAPWLRRGSLLILVVPACIVAVFALNQRFGPMMAEQPVLARFSHIILINSQWLVFMFIGTVVHMVHRRLWRAEIAMAMVAALVVVNVTMFANGPLRDAANIAYSYGIALIIFLAAAAWPKIVPGGQIATFFARISYPLYVIHAVAGYAVLRVLLDLGMQRTPALLLVTAIAIALSALLHHLIERPTQTLGRKAAQRLSAEANADFQSSAVSTKLA